MNFPREKVGLCMIVKNEERALARCLASVRNWVGEMVVVDTGSTDGTIDIAKAYGARVSFFSWCDDFAAARNAALDQVTCEWVLVLDGDETLTVEDPAAFQAALLQSQWDGFSVPIRSFNDDGTYSKAMVFRLFRRECSGMRYRGEIHEQLQAVSEGKLRTSSLSCLYLDHDGYTAAIVASANKAQRNIRLSHKLTESRPDDPFSWFVYAMALVHSDGDSMLAAAHRAIELINADPARVQGEHYVVNLYLSVVNLYLQRGAVEQAIEMANRALALFPESPDLLYKRGSVRIAEGKFVGAVEDFRRALSDAALGFKLVVDPAAIGHGVRTGLAHALRQIGRRDEALEQLRIALEQSPADYASAHAEMGALLIDSGAIEQAVPFFVEACNRSPGNAALALKLGWCLHKQARFGEAEAALSGHVGDQQIDALLARVLLDTGRAQQACELLASNVSPAALLTRGLASFVLGRHVEAGSDWDAWLLWAVDGNANRSAVLLFRKLVAEGAADYASQRCPEVPREIDVWLLLLLQYQQTESLERIVQRGPLLLKEAWPAIRMRWAQAMVQKGYVEAGMSLLFEAVRELPQDGAAYYWLGYCAILRGQPQDARVMFEECLRCDPQHPQAAQALLLL
nr:tetratricopeptide repeat protein [uncultured Rhodoferax sp.]